MDIRLLLTLVGYIARLEKENEELKRQLDGEWEQWGLKELEEEVDILQYQLEDKEDELDKAFIDIFNLEEQISDLEDELEEYEEEIEDLKHNFKLNFKYPNTYKEFKDYEYKEFIYDNMVYCDDLPIDIQMLRYRILKDK